LQYNGSITVGSIQWKVPIVFGKIYSIHIKVDLSSSAPRIKVIMQGDWAGVVIAV